jgi:hypothetical protein
MFRGLNIERILRPNDAQNVVPAGKTHLDAMLTKYNFPKASFDEKLAVRFEEAVDKNFDAEEESQDQSKNAGSKSIFFTKRVRVTTKCLLERLEIDNTRQSNEITKELCDKLAQDAFLISNAHTDNRTREATTCICVVLRNESQFPYKFVFHNRNGNLPRSMRDEAARLKYCIKNIELGHAEVNMVDYLMYSARQHLTERVDSKPKNKKYTHILGMGCSRKHCQECNALLNLFLGCGYSVFTAAMEKLSCRPVIDYRRKAKQEDHRLLMKSAEPVRVLFQDNSIRYGGNRSLNNRLSIRMQTEINTKSGLSSPLDFTGARFNINGSEESKQPRAND